MPAGNQGSAAPPRSAPGGGTGGGAGPAASGQRDAHADNGGGQGGQGGGGQRGRPRGGSAPRGGKQTPGQAASGAGSKLFAKVVEGKGSHGDARTYHRVVLAEFVVCIFLVGMSPILTPRQPGEQDSAAAGLSLAGPLVRLTAVCVLFFVLALMATGDKAGKLAAAFGGLVVLGTLLNATDEIAVLGHALARTGPADSTSPPPPGAGEGGGGGAGEGGSGAGEGGGGHL